MIECKNEKIWLLYLVIAKNRYNTLNLNNTTFPNSAKYSFSIIGCKIFKVYSPIKTAPKWGCFIFYLPLDEILNMPMYIYSSLFEHKSGLKKYLNVLTFP